MKVILLGGIALLLSLPLSTASAFEVTGLSTPESFIVDSESGEYFISNINGAPTNKDNNGFITKLDPNGKIIALRFIDSSKGGPLHAPKGLTMVGKTLYVTDIDHVKGYNTESGQLVQDIDFAQFGASFLNDLTHDAQGNLYVSDMTGNFIVRIDTIEQHKVSIVVKGVHLGQPNGLVIHPKTKNLVMVSWAEGKVVEITSQGTLKPLITKTFKNLDGVDFDPDGTLYFSSFTEGKIYRVSVDGKVSIFQEGLKTPADINIDQKKNLLLVPSFEGNSARTIPLK